MNKQAKEKWVEALRSGKHKQGKRVLRDNGRYCCLGVLCEISGLPYNDHDAYPPASVCDWAGLLVYSPPVLIDGKELALTTLNDDYRMSFNEIADLIESQL